MVIMTNNQWKCDENNDDWRAIGMDCSAQSRSVGLLKAYKGILPDIIGIQESSSLMEKLLMQQLFAFTSENGENVEYRLITGGDTPIYYRSDKYFVVESGYCQHPEHLPGAEGIFNNKRTKSYTYGIFDELATGKKVLVISTHLWWKSSNPERFNYQPHSSEARAYQITLVLEKAKELMEKYNCPGFVLGDFNAGLGSICMDKVYHMGWIEARDICTGEKNDTKGHHLCNPSGFRRDPLGKYEEALDHIVVPKDTDVKIRSYKRLDDGWFDCISDHYPLYIDVEI